MKARIPSHREFIINFPDSVDQAKANEGWAKLQQIVEDYKKAHNGASVYAPTFIEDCEPAVKKLQEEYGFEYTVEYVRVGLLGKLLISGKMELMLQSVLKNLAEVHIALKGCGIEPRRESDRAVDGAVDAGQPDGGHIGIDQHHPLVVLGVDVRQGGGGPG